MYCFEAHKCTKYDCPVQRKQIRKCWEYLTASLNREITTEDCPYAPCEKCNYRLGWEIGLIGDSLFPENEDPTPETLVPVITEASETTSDLPETTETKESTAPETTENQNFPEIGNIGMRFCHEVVECPNPNCTVKAQQIIQCFRFFSRKTQEEKQQMTCTSRKCDECFYKRGWDIGILNEALFKDIIEKKKLNILSVDRSKKNTLVEIYLSELSKKPLNRAEEYALAQKIAGDKEASELFLMANLKLVMRVAKKFSGSSLGIMDLIQEGNIGLIKAIAKFDHTLGYRFSTYAAYWIRYYMQKAVASQSTSIKIPHHLLTVAHKIQRQIQEFENQFFRAPSISELSKLLGLEEEKILSVLRLTQAPVSIHTRVGEEDEEGTLEYFIADKKTLTPEEAAFEKIKNEAVANAVKRLPERLRYIVENFYGFAEEELSLAEIGRRLDISRERARQLLAQALQILEKENLIADFADFRPPPL